MTVRCARAPVRSSRSHALVLAVLLGLGALGAGAPARATVFTAFDFETPEYGACGHRVSDHFLLKEAGVWHLFYTELAGGAVPVTRIGHATSPDLAHWTEHPTVIAAGAAPWCDKGTWAPHVTVAPGGGWVMLFTGKSAVGSESIGALTSSDLETWLIAPENPVFTPSTSWARWGPDFYCSCRDPFVWFENGVYNMLYTVVTVTPERPALGRAESLDLLHWSDRGAFAIDSLLAASVDVESASLVFRANRVELHFTRNYTQMLSAPTSAGPWDFTQAVTVDGMGGAGELVPDGAATLFSRVRLDWCNASTGVIVIDTVTATANGYKIPSSPRLPGAWILDGDAFASQPVYSDGPRLRGDTPASPEGLRWLGSGESLRQPGDAGGCVYSELGDRVGTARSPQFTLQGDLVSFKLSGKADPANTYAALIDDCTGQELARTTGPGTSALAPFSWSNAGRRGWAVRLLLSDQATGPGGVLGLDAVRDSAVGNPALPTMPVIDETAPAGGENLTPGSTYTIRWTGSSAAGIDSFQVWVSYDNFATPPTKLARRNSNQFSFNWTVPPGPKFTARIRVVIYAKNSVHTCDESGPFSIGVTTGVGDPPAGPVALALAARAQPGPEPVLEWSAPPGGPASLALYDVRGRRVRRLYEGPGAVLARTPWDGLDDSGRPAPSGIYFARLVSGGETVSAHLVRLAH
jgi:hypothetical protein